MTCGPAPRQAKAVESLSDARFFRTMAGIATETRLSAWRKRTRCRGAPRNGDIVARWRAKPHRGGCALEKRSLSILLAGGGAVPRAALTRQAARAAFSRAWGENDDA